VPKLRSATGGVPEYVVVIGVRQEYFVVLRVLQSYLRWPSKHRSREPWMPKESVGTPHIPKYSYRLLMSQNTLPYSEANCWHRVVQGNPAWPEWVLGGTLENTLYTPHTTKVSAIALEAPFPGGRPRILGVKRSA
jgi:hypothetical protein